MEIVVEILDAGVRHTRVEKLDTNELRIGRAWNSDVLVTDPDVDAEHLLIELADDGETFALTDLQSTNGSRYNKKKFEGQIQADFGDLIQLGNTRLRIHRLNDPVAVTKQRTLLDNQLALLHRPIIVLGLATAAILLQLMDMYLSTTRELEWHSVLTGLIGMTSGLAIFALLLAGLSKLFRNEFVYWPNLGLAASAIILQKLLGFVASWISFNLLSQGLDEFIATLITATILTLWLIPSLHLCTPLKPWIRNTITASVVIITVTTSYILPSFRENSWQHSQPQLVSGSLPAPLLIAPRVSREFYLEQMASTFDRADELAAEAREEQEENKGSE